ncbi:unnamed protein product [Lactuca virosa]|uniref:IST1-like protein n=1 Tax=Lactuca virosa TaxID=75947 RepID=A0AAU9N6T2_9ASTR|nr:unnamed protein product [Lactuca virosa]
MHISSTMLHKSFKPAKCKTSLKLATSRIKLMRNKKGVQINQMKRELAQLLETGQDRTARIRVEHVIREEKMVAAYELIDIYCELIVARMPIIESQKTCPIDLKEAVTSVLFAAPRCSDISELVDIKKQFTSKYGKEFVSAALELRPDSGVSRMLVEKLSAVAPDIQTKVKVLTAIAKEHNINWEPTSFEEKESKPPNDLLNGPNSFENASMANANPSKIQPSNVNAVHSHEKKPGPPLDFAEQNRKYVVDNGVATSSSGITSEKMEMRGDDDFSSGGQNWNMGFKDATSAAEAAAESAERAAIAARAAAQFASHEKITTRDETPRKSKIINQQMDQSENENERKDNERVHEANTRSNKSNSSKESKLESGKKNSFSGDRKPKITNQQINRNEHGEKDNDRFHEANTRSSRKTSLIESKTEFESGKKEGFESENINLFAEEMFKKQPCVHSTTSSDEPDDEVVSDDRKAGKRSVVGNPFAVVDQRNAFSQSTKSKSDLDDQRDNEAVFDDDHDDDDDGPKFDTGFEYDEVEATSYFQSPGLESSTHSLEHAHVWSPKRNESIKFEKMSSESNLFSQSVSFGEHSVKSMEPSETEDGAPVSFDHSDGESESEFNGNNKLDNVLSANPETLPRKSRIELNDLVEEESSFDDDPKDEEKRHSSSILLKKQDSLEDNNDDDFGKELKFGTLTGGLRNKGGVLKFPPYTKPTTTNALNLSKKSVDESSVTITENETSLNSSLDSRAGRMGDKKASVTISTSDSDSDDSGDKFPARSRFVPPTPFFDDDDDDDVETASEEVSKKAPISSVRLRTELSRRTRGSPSVSNSKTRVDPEPKTVLSPESRFNSRKTTEIGSSMEGQQQKPKKEMESGPTPRNSDESGEKKIVGKTEKPSVENIAKKPSYVHPKLPDYDTFAARLQTLRNEHK